MSARADALVETELERQFLDQLRAASGEVDGPMERHCVRLFLFAEMLAAERGVEIDRELVLCAAFMHDAGLYDSISHGGVYTDEGGEHAARLFERAGASPERVRMIADACAQHHALRDQSRRGTEVELIAARRPDRGQRRDPERGPRARARAAGVLGGPTRRLLLRGRRAARARASPPAAEPAADLQDRLR